jgi:hypothetical protein
LKGPKEEIHVTNKKATNIKRKPKRRRSTAQNQQTQKTIEKQKEREIKPNRTKNHGLKHTHRLTKIDKN